MKEIYHLFSHSSIVVWVIHISPKPRFICFNCIIHWCLLHFLSFDIYFCRMTWSIKSKYCHLLICKSWVLHQKGTHSYRFELYSKVGSGTRKGQKIKLNKSKCKWLGLRNFYTFWKKKTVLFMIIFFSKIFL